MNISRMKYHIGGNNSITVRVLRCGQYRLEKNLAHCFCYFAVKHQTLVPGNEAAEPAWRQADEQRLCGALRPIRRYP